MGGRFDTFADFLGSFLTLITHEACVLILCFTSIFFLSQGIDLDVDIVLDCSRHKSEYSFRLCLLYLNL